jgi:hypothetical protein
VIVYSGAGKIMSKIMKGKFKDMPRSRISEAVWAAVIGMAATHNAHADQADNQGLEAGAQNKLDDAELQKEESALVAMGGAGAGSEQNILGDGAVAEHSGEEGGKIAETSQSDVLAQSVEQHDTNVQTQTDNTSVQAAATQEVDASEGLVASNVDGVDMPVTEDLDMNTADAPAGPIVAGMEFDAGLLGFLGVAAVGAVAYAASDSDDDDAATSPADTATPLAGTAIDGYVAGGKVWADKNGDGKMTSDETTTTDSNGDFSFEDIGSATSVTILGGTGRDVMTGEVVKADMIGTINSAGEIVVSPLTTLIASGANEADLKDALGLDSSVDLSTFDPIEAITSTDPAQQDLGESIFVAAQQVMTVIQAGVANGAGSVENIAKDLADSINSSAEGASFSETVETVLDADVAAVVNNVNAAIEDSLDGKLVEAFGSGEFGQIVETMDVVAIAQTEMVKAVGEARDTEGGIDLTEWDADGIAQKTADWNYDLKADGFEFLVDQGLSLTGADLEITDQEFLETIIEDSSGAFDGANIEIDDSLSSFADVLADKVGSSEGVVVGELGDY